VLTDNNGKKIDRVEIFNTSTNAKRLQMQMDLKLTKNQKFDFVFQRSYSIV
jgi:hypothetical protein